MTTTLLDIRFIIERNIGDTLDNDTMIHWMNDGQMDFGVNLYIPETAQITLDTTSLSYNEPAQLKQIVRMWLQSDYDNGVDREFRGPYRRYNGKIIFPIPFPTVDTLNVDYFKTMKYFAAITDTIDIADRFTPIYTTYGEMRYYMLPRVAQQLGNLGQRNLQTAQQTYQMLKRQVVQEYSFQNPDYAIKERW